MALSDLQVFSEFAYSSMTELCAQQVQLFNTASRGGLILRAGQSLGDYSDNVIYQKISGLVRRRNAYGTGAQAEKTVAQLDETAVKVAAGIPPIRIDPSMLRWIQRAPDEAGIIVGKQMAMDTIQDFLNAAILGFTTAIGNVSTLVFDNTGTGKASLGVLSQGAAKFGDRSSSIACWIMHSKSAFDIYAQALKGDSFLFRLGDVRIADDGFGRPIIITDSPNLTYADGQNTRYLCCGLVPGGVDIVQNDDYQDNTQTINGDENIKRTYQAEWSFNMRVLGFSWSKANGGHSPTDAAIGTAANWVQYATSIKDTAGVLVKVQ